MKKILILGCNGITDFIVPRLMGLATISEIIIASRDKAECDELRKKYSGKGPRITTARVDMENEQGTKMMLSITNPDLIVSLVPAKYSLTVMKLALGTGADYIDGALYDWGDGDLLSKQFGMFSDFRASAKMAVTGCALNPGIMTSLVRIAMRDDFDSVSSAQVLEVNLSPEDPAESDAVMIENGEKKVVKAMSERVDLDENYGEFKGKKLFLADSPVTQDFLKEIPGVPNVKCYVSREVEEEPDFTEELTKLGMLSEEPIEVFPGVMISPKQFWEKYRASMKKEVKLSGACGAGVIVEGRYRGEDKREFIYFTGDNDETTKAYNISGKMLFDAYALLSGITLICSGRWLKSGVFTPSAFEPDLFINGIKSAGLTINTKAV